MSATHPTPKTTQEQPADPRTVARVAISQPAPLSNVPASNGPVGPPIVFFDGVCGLCNKTVNRLLALDTKGVLRFAPLQGPTALERLRTKGADTVPPDVNSAEWLRSLVLLDQTGEYRYSSGIVRILWHLGGVCGVLGSLLWIIPRPLRDWGYRLVAQNRYQIWGKLDACRLPTPAERSRFLP